MMTLKEMLLERKIDQSERLGCLMAMVDESVSSKILEFNKKLIKEEDLYHKINERGEDEFGREKECHVTIRYGFTKDLNELDVRQLLKGHKEFLVEVNGLDIFDTNPDFDVVKFNVNSPTLTQLNELSGIYPNKSDYPNYHPHLTLAYVKKGTFPHKKKIQIKIPIKSVCYSPISGGKSHFQLDEGDEYNSINNKIIKLEQEWERLDATGTGSVRQREIERELIQLRFEKEMYRNVDQQINTTERGVDSTKVPVDQTKGKELFKQLKQSISEIEYPLAKKGELQSYEGHVNWKGKIVWMSPDKFLNLCYPLPSDEKNDDSSQNLRKRMIEKLPIDFLVLKVDSKQNKVTGHEGRHRATVAKELGIEKVPVLIYFEEGYPRVPKWGQEHHKFADDAEFKPEWSNLEEGQHFDLMGMRFDVDEALKLIAKKKLQPKNTDIKKYAENVLGLKRENPEHKPQSFFAGIDYDYLDKIPEDRLKVAGIIATIRTPDKKVWSIVMDGNHRLAKNYMNGKDTMSMYILNEKDTKSIMF